MISRLAIGTVCVLLEGCDACNGRVAGPQCDAATTDAASCVDPNIACGACPVGESCPVTNCGICKCVLQNGQPVLSCGVKCRVTECPVDLEPGSKPMSFVPCDASRQHR